MIEWLQELCSPTRVLSTLAGGVLLLLALAAGVQAVTLARRPWGK